MPQAVAKARGSWLYAARKKRGCVDVAPVSSVPNPPIELDEDARTCWNDVAPRLIETGVLSEHDCRALARYCRIWSLWISAIRWIDKHGTHRAVMDENGNDTGAIAEWPQVKRVIDYDSALRRLEQEFGLTPSARSSVFITKKQDDQAKAAKFLRISK